MDLALQDVSKKITRLDIAICIITLVLSLAAITAIVLPQKAGKIVVIEVDGKLYGRYDISGEKKEVEIKSKYGYNVVSIGEGYAAVIYADCPDKLDVKRGKISKVGESIICLPNRVRIYIEGENKKQDSMSY